MADMGVARVWLNISLQKKRNVVTDFAKVIRTQVV